MAPPADTMRRPQRLLLALVCALGLGGCSLAELAYDNSPSIVAGRFDDAFDVDEIQRQQLEERLEAYLAWHRENELTGYESLLREAAARAEDGIAAADTLWLVDEVRAAWRRGVARLLDEVADLGTTLTPAQLERLEEYFEEYSEDYADYLEMSEQQRAIHRAQRRLKRLERVFGDFDDYLEARVLARLEQLPDLWGPWLEFRQARFAAQLAALRQHDDAEALKQALHRIWLSPDSDHARRFEPRRAAYWREFAAALEEIDGWLRPHHRRRAIERLRDYADTIADLRPAS